MTGKKILIFTSHDLLSRYREIKFRTSTLRPHSREFITRYAFTRYTVVSIAVQRAKRYFITTTERVVCDCSLIERNRGEKSRRPRQITSISICARDRYGFAHLIRISIGRLSGLIFILIDKPGSSHANTFLIPCSARRIFSDRSRTMSKLELMIRCAGCCC